MKMIGDAESVAVIAIGGKVVIRAWRGMKSHAVAVREKNHLPVHVVRFSGRQNDFSQNCLEEVQISPKSIPVIANIAKNKRVPNVRAQTIAIAQSGTVHIVVLKSETNN